MHRSGIRGSVDLGQWDHDPGDIQRMRSLVVRSYGMEYSSHPDAERSMPVHAMA
jgi:hypothetical protein